MQYLYFLLMVAGIILLIIGFKTIPRLVNTKLLYEMPCVDKEGTFFLPKGMYGIWLSGKLFTKSPIGKVGFKITNQQTGRTVPLSISILKTSSSGFTKGRMELYWFQAEEGNYLLSLAGEGNIIERAEAAIADIIIKKPVDYSQFSVQIRERHSVFIFLLSILEIVLGMTMMKFGIIQLVAL